MHSPPGQGSPPPLGLLRHMRYQQFYPLRMESVRHARTDFRTAVNLSQLEPEVAEAAELALSELATNAVRHAKDPRTRRWFHVNCAVLGQRHRFLEIGVHDVDAAHIPVPPDPATAFDRLLDMGDATSGRGLLIVAHMADGIGVDHGPAVNGKRVWCRWYLTKGTVPDPAGRDPRVEWACPTSRA